MKNVTFTSLHSAHHFLRCDLTEIFDVDNVNVES